MAKESVHALGERVGVNAVEAVFLKEMGWIFREQPHTDWGVDALVEVTDEGIPTGKLIALQIKSGASYFKQENDGGYVYRGKLRHLNYWTNHSLPVFVVLHNPDTGEMIFARVERRLCTLTKKGWSMVILKRNVLDARARRFLQVGISTDAESLRRYRFTADHQLMKEVRERKTFFVWEDWVNKTLGIRNLAIYFDELNKDKPDCSLGYVVPTHDVHFMMTVLFPWLTYEYEGVVENCSLEVELHTLAVKLRPEAVAFLELEEFFRSGPVGEEVPEAPRVDEDDDELYDPGWDGPEDDSVELPEGYEPPPF